MTPVWIVGAGVVGAIALFVLWPQGGGGAAGGGASSGGAAAQGSAGGGRGGAGGPAGPGVQARSVDPAAAGGPRVSAAVLQTGLAPEKPPAAPPTFATPEDELSYWKDQLNRATAMRDSRKTFHERAIKKAEGLSERPESDPERAAAEAAVKTTQSTLDEAQKRVDELTTKVDELEP